MGSRSQNLCGHQMDLLCHIVWMKEMTLDKTKERRTHGPLHIQVLTVERKSSFIYLGVHISEDHTRTQLVKRAQLWLRNFDI